MSALAHGWLSFAVPPMLAVSSRTVNTEGGGGLELTVKVAVRRWLPASLAGKGTVLVPVCGDSEVEQRVVPPTAGLPQAGLQAAVTLLTPTLSDEDPWT